MPSTMQYYSVRRVTFVRIRADGADHRPQEGDPAGVDENCLAGEIVSSANSG